MRYIEALFIIPRYRGGWVHRFDVRIPKFQSDHHEAAPWTAGELRDDLEYSRFTPFNQRRVRELKACESWWQRKIKNRTGRRIAGDPAYCDLHEYEKLRRGHWKPTGIDAGARVEHKPTGLSVIVERFADSRRNRSVAEWRLWRELVALKELQRKEGEIGRQEEAGGELRRAYAG